MASQNTAGNPVGRQMTVGKVLALSLLASASPLAITPASAQNAPAAQSDVAPGEIVVTATKRSEALQNVPIAITAFTNAQLTQHQVANFDDYAKLMPAVSYQSFGPGQTSLNFRGVTDGGDGLAIGPLPTAGVYVNETPVTTIYGAVDLHIYDMDHVEALSGPQGTLYGASSLAGTLRLITAAPKLGKWQGGVDGEINSFGHGGGVGGKLEGYLNIPISANAALRVVGFYEHDGGYISNSPASRTYLRTDYNGVNQPLTVNNAPFVKKNFNTVDQFGGRAALKVDLDENWTVTPMVIYQHQVAKGTYLYNDPNNANYSAGYVPGYGNFQVHDFTPDHDQDSWYLASLTLQGKISDWDVTYNGSYFHRKADIHADYSYFTTVYDGLSIPGYTYFTDSSGKAIDPTQTYHQNDVYTKMSHEFRVSSPASNPWKLTAGLYWQRQTNEHIADYIVNGLSTSQQYTADGWYIAGAPADDVYYTNAYRVDRDYAMFAEGSYDITKNVTLIAGIRGFIADNTLAGWSGGASALANQAGVANCAVVTVQACPNIGHTPGNTPLKAVASGETHKAEIKWQFTHDDMVYAIYSTGFRPGGNNRLAIALGQVQNIPPFGPDTLTNYEIGWKLGFLNRKLWIDGAVFDEEWHNIQYSEPGLLGIYYTVNAGNARSRGVEGSIDWRAAPGLTLSTNGTYIDAKLTTPFLGAPAGTRLPVTPKFKVNATARYEMHLGSSKAFLQGSINHQGGTTSYLTTAGEAALGPTAGFTTVDFSAGLSHDAWNFTVFAANAFNEMGVLSKNSVCTPGICGQLARLYPTKPQQFGLRAGYKF